MNIVVYHFKFVFWFLSYTLDIYKKELKDDKKGKEKA